MAKIERPKGRDRAPKRARPLTLLGGKGQGKVSRSAPTGAQGSATKGAKSSPDPQSEITARYKPKLRKQNKNKKIYFLHYKKGKYILINLSLKKKGHQQRY
jgi:hypothetical protein